MGCSFKLSIFNRSNIAVGYRPHSVPRRRSYALGWRHCGLCSYGSTNFAFALRVCPCRRNRTTPPSYLCATLQPTDTRAPFLPPSSSYSTIRLSSFCVHAAVSIWATFRRFSPVFLLVKLTFGSVQLFVCGPTSMTSRLSVPSRNDRTGFGFFSNYFLL